MKEKNRISCLVDVYLIPLIPNPPTPTICSLWFTHIAAHLGFLGVFMLLENPVVSPGRSVQS
jgi:hypothetical protein